MKTAFAAILIVVSVFGMTTFQTLMALLHPLFTVLGK